MSSSILVLVSAFVTVFCLGLQSLNVNQGHYAAAIVTSFFISTGSIFLYRYMAVSTPADITCFYIGASSGIAFSIYFHRRAKAWLAVRIAAWRTRRTALIRRGPPRPIPPCTPRIPDEHADVAHCGAHHDTH